jgi:carbamoyl-phosphate synthase large subunit
MNILFTSSGRRGYLLDYFRTALPPQSLIHAANSAGNVSSFQHADKTVTTPLIYSTEYIDFLLEYCAKEHIEVIIPLFDIDIPVLAQAKARFVANGVTVIVPSPEIARMCNDKLETVAFMERNGLAAPMTFMAIETAIQALQSGKLCFPLVIKPRWGMGSIGLQFAENLTELHVMFAKVQRQIQQTYLKYESGSDLNQAVLIQEQLGGQEYGLDIVNDLQGLHITTFVKQKLAMRSGETDAAVTIADSELVELGRKLGTITGHPGNMDADVFRTNGQLYVLELNARFGGGYPFSHLAGADLPLAIVKWLAGKSVPHEALRIEIGVTGIKDILPVRLSRP